jgi:hypothetical protein
MGVGLEGLVALLLFIAPGFLYSRSYLAARPHFQRVPELFQQTVLAVVGSALIHAGLLSISALLVLIYSVVTGHNPLCQDE